MLAKIFFTGPSGRWSSYTPLLDLFVDRSLALHASSLKKLSLTDDCVVFVEPEDSFPTVVEIVSFASGSGPGFFSHKIH